jgi:ATP-dependent protease ClpP protease subunit
MFKKLFVAAMLALMLAFAPMAMAEDTPKEKASHSHFLNDESAGKLSRLSFVTKGKAYFKLFSGISVADFVMLKTDLIKLRDYTDIRDLTIILNSPGGSAFDGLSMADCLVTAQKEWGFTVTVKASGIVASAAVPIFAVCEHRFASPGTLFMVHEAALWKWPGRETMSDIISYLVENSTTSMKTWKKMEKLTTWFTVKKARKLGLIERKPKHEERKYSIDG